MKVIFLDFDGVIVTAHSRFQTGDPYCIHWLNDIVAETGAKVVVSSMWRMGRSVEELQSELDGWGAKVEVIGKTPLDHSVIRGVEIERWLKGRDLIESFVILDDDSDMGELMPRLVKTNAIHGMEYKHAKIAKAILGITPAADVTNPTTELDAARKKEL